MQTIRMQVENTHWWSDLCGHVDGRTRRRLRKIGRESMFEPEEIIVAEGSRADRFSLVLSGLVEVEADGRVVATLGPDQFFGEVAMLYARPRAPKDSPDTLPRTATVRAVTRVRLHQLNRAELATLMDAAPTAATRISRRAIGRLAVLNPRTVTS